MEDGEYVMELSSKNTIALCILLWKTPSLFLCNEWKSKWYIISARKLAFIYSRQSVFIITYAFGETDLRNHAPLDLGVFRFLHI